MSLCISTCSLFVFILCIFDIEIFPILVCLLLALYGSICVCVCVKKWEEEGREDEERIKITLPYRRFALFPGVVQALVCSFSPH